MKTASHVDKFQRLTRLRDRLEPLEDFELWYWTTLTAGTTAYNACLHLTGVTASESAFPTIPGMHVVEQPDGTYARELRGPGDVSHVNWPSLPGPLPAPVLDIEREMHRLEKYRDPCLRGEEEPTVAIVSECEEIFASVTATLTQVLGRSA